MMAACMRDRPTFPSLCPAILYNMHSMSSLSAYAGALTIPLDGQGVLAEGLEHMYKWTTSAGACEQPAFSCRLPMSSQDLTLTSISSNCSKTSFQSGFPGCFSSSLKPNFWRFSSICLSDRPSSMSVPWCARTSSTGAAQAAYTVRSLDITLLRIHDRDYANESRSWKASATR